MGYYVYRFVDGGGHVLYIGKTANINRVLYDNPHLSDKVESIEYIMCEKECDMVWKSIYYINLFKSHYLENAHDIYDGVTNIGLSDRWEKYSKSPYFGFDVGFVKETYVNLMKSIKGKNHDYSSLIHVLDHKKLNTAFIGDETYAYSQTWFIKYEKNDSHGRTQRNIENYFRNIMAKDAKGEKISWTTFGKIQSRLKGKGYSKGYIDMFDYETDKHNAKYLAFIGNIYVPEKVSMNKNHDEFATMVLILFMFNSVLRDGKEIWIYIPSVRMRTLLKQWIDENS